MRIGYPCVNYIIGCRANRTFRLKSYSDRYLKDTVESNLSCLYQILNYNVQHQLFFFRIGSELIPFASHPICRFDWPMYFETEFKQIGLFIRKHRLRVSMHPDPFTLINAEEESIFLRSLEELNYHVQVFECLKLDSTAKIQIHIGGIYGNKSASIQRFIRRYHQLDDRLKRYLVIENDDINYSVRDCLIIHKKTHIPVVLDVFHHQLHNNGESISEVFDLVRETWGVNHGPMMVDYSSQQPRSRKGTHATTVDTEDFKRFIYMTKRCDFDLMLEIKDKESSAIKAVKIVKKWLRSNQPSTNILNPLTPHISSTHTLLE
jgi:UV DNA damage endonuclease